MIPSSFKRRESVMYDGDDECVSLICSSIDLKFSKKHIVCVSLSTTMYLSKLSDEYICKSLKLITFSLRSLLETLV